MALVTHKLMVNTLYVIPARSGSKEIPNKNISLFQGLPLFLYSYNYALKSVASYDHIVISTDSLSYADTALSHGIPSSSILIRPKCLAEDCVQDYPVALHAWSSLEQTLSRQFNYIAWLRPTSPYRPSNLLYQGINLLEINPLFTSVRSMRPCTEHPYRIWNVDGQLATPLIDLCFEPGNLPRQTLPSCYYFQSGELEITRRSTLQRGSISGSNVGALILNNFYPDIDSSKDLHDAINFRAS